MTRGEEAERLVEERLRKALPESEYRVYVNVNWTGPVRSRGPARDGEADAVIAHPEYGLLVLEVKAGEPSIDQAGHWHLGPIELRESPIRAGQDIEVLPPRQAGRPARLALRSGTADRPRGGPPRCRPGEPATRPLAAGGRCADRSGTRCPRTGDDRRHPEVARPRLRLLAWRWFRPLPAHRREGRGAPR